MVKVASIKKFTKDLTSRQKKTMNRHARHHSLKHMRAMANAMKKGATFGQAHTRAMSGFTTTATISELIDKRPMTKRRGRSKRRIKTSFKAPQRVLKVKKV